MTLEEALALLDDETYMVLASASEPIRVVVAAAREHLSCGGEAARAYLASQEQTPDYQAASDEWDRDVVRMFDAAHEYDNDDWLLKRLTRCVDAALVGFHPQPEGDETPDPDPQRVPADWSERLSKLKAREEDPESPEVPT